MLCFLCGKKIGILRRLVDQQYCSRRHRHEARLAATKVFREEEDQEMWTVARSRQQTGRPATKSGQTASIFAFAVVGALLVAALMMPGQSPAAGTPAYPRVSDDSSLKTGLLQRAGDAISGMIRAQAPVTLREDFRSGWSEWTLAGAVKTGKRRSDDPGALRIWNRSTTLANYEMQFSGEIQKKSLSWVFRATDEKNYYATKIVIAKPGPAFNAGLVRYVMLDGRESDRAQLPLPLTLTRGEPYTVRVSVRGERFVTYVNGQPVSSWSDNRLHRGGIGFFSDQEDPQRVAWVSLSERDSVLGQMLGRLSLIWMPGAGPAWSGPFPRFQ